MITAEPKIISSPPEALYVELCRKTGELEIQRNGLDESPTYIFHQVANIGELQNQYLRAVPIIEQTARLNGLVYEELNLQSRRGQICISELDQSDTERMLCFG